MGYMYVVKQIGLTQLNFQQLFSFSIIREKQGGSIADDCNTQASGGDGDDESRNKLLVG